MGSRRGTAALAIAAGLAAPGSLASASSQTADPKLVVDPITSTFYLDSKTRGRGQEDRSGSSSQAQASSGGSALVFRPSHAGLVLGLGSGVAYGSRLFFGGSGSKFLGKRQQEEVEENARAKAAAKAAAAEAKKEHAKHPEEEAAADGASGLPFMKVGGAMFVGIAASLALRRALRSTPPRTAVAARAAVVTEVNKAPAEPAVETKRSPRRSSEPQVRAVSADGTSCSDYSEILVSRNDSAEDLGRQDRAPNAEEISAAVGRLPLPPLGVDPKMMREKDGSSPRRFTIGTPYERKAMSPKTQQFNIGTPPARDFSSPVELNHYDEPQPELEPGQEQKIDDRLQPGNKGYVHKRKSEYDAKAEVEKAEAAGTRTLQRRSLDARRTEFHRIMTDPHNDLGGEAFQHPNEIGNDFEADLSSFNSTLSQRELDAAGNTNTSFFRIHTEG